MQRIAIVICIVVLICSSQVFAAIGTVTLKSGTVYERVNYIVDYDNKVLLIESGGWTQRILSERIEKVMTVRGTILHVGPGFNSRHLHHSGILRNKNKQNCDLAYNFAL